MRVVGVGCRVKLSIKLGCWVEEGVVFLEEMDG